MLIDGKTIEELTEADLRQMVEIGRSEDQYLDFKRELYGNSDADSKEFLKDVAGLANASGGMLLLGVEDKADVAFDVPGVAIEEPHVLRDSMEKKITHGLEPILSGVRIKTIPLDSGKHVVAIAVPQSINRPHRAIVTKGGRFSIRRNSRTEEMTYDELKNLFLDSAGVEERVRQMQEKSRDAFLAKQSKLPSRGSGTLVVHLLPLSTRGRTLDVRAVIKERDNFMPGQPPAALLSANFNGVRGEWNLIKISRLHGWGWIQIHRNGMIESWTGSYLGGEENLFFMFENLSNHLFKVIPNYLIAIDKLEYHPPYALALSLLGFSHQVRIGRDYAQSTNHDPNILLEPIYLEQPALTGGWQRVLRPIFDQMWNAFGKPACPNFDDDGNWHDLGTHRPP